MLIPKLGRDSADHDYIFGKGSGAMDKGDARVFCFVIVIVTTKV